MELSAPAPADGADPDRESTAGHKSRIVRSTIIIGGSSAVTVILRVIRAKALAILLGPGGVGLFSMYDSIVALANSVVSMGVGTSGVRQIAEADGSGDRQRIAKTVLCLRRVALASGIAGLFGLCLLSRPLSLVTFRSTLHAADIALLSITVLCSSIAGGQVALIQGLRRIKDLALLGMAGAFLGTVFSVLAIVLLGERGIAVSLILASSFSVATSWWYARKVAVPKPRLSWPEFMVEARPLVTLGFFFMVSAVMSTGALYLSRLIILHRLGIGPLGIYQAALALSSVYVGFILDAMGKDFYPSLTALSKDPARYSPLVNSQIEIGLLIALPGILATMTFAPFIITLFYSAQFIVAAEVLRWQIIGMLLRIIVWPMAFLILAKGEGKLFLLTESFGNGMSLLLLWVCVLCFGLPGAGISFLCGYLFYGLLITGITVKKYRFRLSRQNVRLSAASLVAISVLFLLHRAAGVTAACAVGCVLLIAAGGYSLRTLLRGAGLHPLKRFLKRFKTPTPSGSGR